MPQIDPVIIQLRADLAKYRNDLKSTTVLVETSLRRQEKAVTALESRMESGFGKIGASIARFVTAFGAVSGIAIARQLIQIADAGKQIDAQLRLATASTGSFAQAQADSRRIAEEARSSLETTTKLYSSFIRASEQTGRSQQDAARATETFAKALKIGGPSAQEAASATLQFNQALTSGVLRGEEFNAIAEASPRILRLLADALGVPQGQLRKLAEEGQITSDVLFSALTDRKFTASIDNEFRQLPKTFDEAMEQIYNAAVVTFGAFDRGGQFSTALANFVLDGGQGLSSLEKRAEDFGINVRATMAGLGDVFLPLLQGGNSVADQLTVRFQGLRNEIAGLLGAADNIRNFGRDFPALIGPNDGYIGRALAPYMQKAPAANDRGRFLQAFDRAQANSRGVAREQRFNDRFGYIPGTMQFRSQQGRVASPPVATGGGGGGRVRRGGATTGRRGSSGIPEVDAFEKSITDMLMRVAQDLRSFEVPLSADPVFGGTDASGSPTGSLDQIYEQIEARRDAEFRLIQEAADARDEAARQSYERRRNDEMELAGLFSDVLNNGLDSAADNFKRRMLAIVAEIVAKLIVAQFDGQQGTDIGAIVGSVFGRASGGRVNAGQLYRVNEGASPGRVEGFRPATSGEVIPLGRMAAQTQIAPQQPVIVELAVGPGQMFEPAVRQISGDVSVRTVRAAAPAILRQAAADAPGAIQRARRYGTPAG